jgi:hypothetical protein
MKLGKAKWRAMDFERAVREELREVAWLASVVFSLSILGVGRSASPLRSVAVRAPSASSEIGPFSQSTDK